MAAEDNAPRILVRNVFQFAVETAAAGAGLQRGEAGAAELVRPEGDERGMGGNAERDLPESAIFEMRTPGGGGWGRA